MSNHVFAHGREILIAAKVFAVQPIASRIQTVSGMRKKLLISLVRFWIERRMKTKWRFISCLLKIERFVKKAPHKGGASDTA
jgi:hypothetical protein